MIEMINDNENVEIRLVSGVAPCAGSEDFDFVNLCPVRNESLELFSYFKIFLPHVHARLYVCFAIMI